MKSIDYIIDRFYEISGLESFSFLQVAHFVLLVLSVFIIELIFVGWQRSSLRVLIKFEKTTRTDFYIWLTEVFGLFNLLAFIFSLGICYFLVGKIQGSMNLQLIHLIENGTAQFIIVYLLSDLKEYFKHYAFHKWGPLWEIHAFHHSAEKFNILTTYRFHYLQSALGTFFDVSLFIILGVPIQTYIAVRILGSIHGLLVHSNIEHDWGFIGRYILVSPAAHRVHHSKDAQHFDKNFGGVFIFWDRLFGTYHKPAMNEELGIPNNEYNKKGIIYDLFLPFIRIKRRISSFLKKA